MNLVPNTPEEILKRYGDRLAVTWGPNVLQQPAVARSSNLVRILGMAALSLSDIQHEVEATVVTQNPNNLEGIALTNYGADRGLERKTGTKSKAVVIVTGQQGSSLEAGSVLKDRYGTEWKTTAQIDLDSVGVGCAFGSGVVCADVAGTFTLEQDELTFDNSTFPFIYAATNGQMLEVGGAVESDAVFRNRILNRGPLSNVNGTADNAVASIMALDDVVFVRYTFVETCIGNGPMFIVYGGRDGDICDTILRRSGVSCNLIGETQCGSCTDVRFQRPCPVLLCIEVSVNPDCPMMTDMQLASLIMSQSAAIATQTKIRAADIANLQQDIDSVRFKVQKPVLMGCPEEDAPEYNDPISNTPIRFGTQNPRGLCGGVSDCETTEFANAVAINPYEYFIMDVSKITFVRTPRAETDCIPNCVEG